MNNKKIFIFTWILIIITIVGNVIPAMYMNMISEGYALYYGLPLHRTFMGISLLLCIAGFLFGISGLIVEITRRNNKGTVICIICMVLNFVFIGHYFSNAVGAATESARRISCASNIKQIRLALELYAIDYSDNFPPANGAAGLEYLRKYDYLTDCAVYTCSSTKTEMGDGNQPLTEQTVDYVYIGGLNEKSDPKSLILYDKPNNHEFFGNVANSNGRVEGVYGNPWMEKIKK